MTTPETISHDPRSVPWNRRLLVRLVAGVALLLSSLSPRRIRHLLGAIRRGASPATYSEAKAARDLVVAVSLACTGPKSCLPRSIATALLCRLRGFWPTWCVGARKIPPFGAHAWVEAEDRLVEEPYPAGYHVVLFSVPPLEPEGPTR
ncbi:hypothetical protein JOF56_009941 [Kibdelosporangium banguiense]|uniref:Microcin J25-processing protein McjB C-terminal domain-containing protein n=1 Tax=Kibdelosporangium banguiense TaxID=1365924 RepID=A0ABS4TYV1_9PSEU|nr:lasso peptide biosynthesis B2 protein [Kibdelosporangium banguiense]MBP2329556.1 hypothetical protein [Kibdelosporangium banguiense]